MSEPIGGWVVGLTATLIREGINKHRAREIAVGYWEAYCKDDDEKEALRADAERLRADAERYRWLRENGSDSRVTEKDGYGGYCLMYYGDLDDAVDTARSET